jgi:hypothetical protein
MKIELTKEGLTKFANDLFEKTRVAYSLALENRKRIDTVERFLVMKDENEEVEDYLPTLSFLEREKDFIKELNKKDENK